MMLTDLLDNKKKMLITQCRLTCNSSTNNISSCTSPISVQCLQGYKLSVGVQNKTTTHVPVLLDWIFPAWNLTVPTPTSDIYRPCFSSSNAVSSSNGSSEIAESWTCYCKFSSRGNPYLPDGCKGVCAGLGGLLFLLVAIWWLTKVIKKRNDMKRKDNFFKRNGGFLLQQEVSSSNGSVEKTKLFNPEELEKATDHYNEDRILGQGG
ncbi:hypothetical protein TEA_019065 [Camellia sinensis var. sinensis]|uniref:Uncharacterized protein n=1 Tax=Camellia sinensis var. sinensis TaxID=542762 RepID=A0A4S4ET78_CAMSN|nr:hypothetical protein TEA_019065 [Camellia sinensis var. sinensis]